MKPDSISFCNNNLNFNRYVLNDPVNKIDPYGLSLLRPQGPVAGPNGAESAPNYVGRENTIVPDGPGSRGEWLENNVPGMHDMGAIHDPVVQALRDAGIPDRLANTPTMVPSYLFSLIGNILGDGLTKYTPCPPDNGDDEPNPSHFTHMGGTIFDN